MEKFKQDQRVHFEMGNIVGDGKIVGLISNEAPILGHRYIVEPDQPINNEIYPYTHFAIYQNQLKTI